MLLHNYFLKIILEKNSESMLPPEIKQTMFFPRQLDSWFFATMMLVAAAPSVIILCFSKLYLILIAMNLQLLSEDTI